jgi:DNA-directed RNA polymerase specialized sigma24 family protein
MPPQESDPSFAESAVVPEHNYPELVAHAAGRVAVPPEATPDLRLLLPEAKAGNESAVLTLHALTQALIAKKLRRYAASGVDVEDLRSVVTEKMFSANFDPNWFTPEGMEPEEETRLILNRYGRYIARTIRSAVSDAASPQAAELPAFHEPAAIAPEPSAGAFKYENGNATASLPTELIESILTPSQLDAFYLRRHGATIAEVSEQLGVTPQAVKSLCNRAIARIEEHILYPAGLHRISYAVTDTVFSVKMVRNAIREGTIQGVMIFGLWYVKTEWLDKLQPPKGVVQLSEVASMATLCAFRRWHPDRLIQHRRRLYIKTHDIGLVQEIADRKKLTRERVTPPKPGYIYIADVDCTASESWAMSNAIQTGIYSSVITCGSKRFVPEAEALAQLERIRSNRAQNTG